MAGQSLESFTGFSLICRMDASVYRLTMFSFALALAHFATEVLVFKTATFNAPGTLSPLIVACEFQDSELRSLSDLLSLSQLPVLFQCLSCTPHT